MRLDHVGRRLHQLDQDTFAANGRVAAPLGVNETDVEARRAFADSARCEAHAGLAEPRDRGSKVVHPETDMIQRRIMNARPTLGIDRLHQIHFDRERTRTRGRDVLVDVLALAPEGSARREPEEVDPESPQRLLLPGANGDLLHSEDAERPICQDSSSSGAGPVDGTPAHRPC